MIFFNLNPFYQQTLQVGVLNYENNIKKTPVKFLEDLLYFQHLCRILFFPKISDYHQLKIRPTCHTGNINFHSLLHGFVALDISFGIVAVVLTRTETRTCVGSMMHTYAEEIIQSNFNGSNTFGTMKICSRQG